MDRPGKRPPLLTRLAPGLLVAATGVGAGDLLNAGIAGGEAAKLGPGVLAALLWAAALGALFKWALNEGLARWQMATGTTLLEGWSARLGPWARWLFLIYFLPWTLFVGGALMSACGVAGDALLPLGGDPAASRAAWALAHSAAGFAMVRAGGFRLFERAMAGCVAAMFAGVIVTAVLIRPDWGGIGPALAAPRLTAGSALWALGVLGGVGGTVTLLSYGYWIREQGRAGRDGLRACRLDLAVAYAGTAAFGLAMIVIGSQVGVAREPGQSLSQVAVPLAEKIGEALGPAGRWGFLLGFWAAVFSSLLGVWQSAPYIFADFVRVWRGRAADPDLAATREYRGYLLAIATVPAVLLFLTVKQVQQAYAVMGAMFMPLLALTLLLMNNRPEWVGREYRNRWGLNALLLLTLATFAAIGYFGVGD